MKISGQTQAEIFKLALYAIAGGVAYYAFKTLGGSIVSSAKDAFNGVLAMPGKAVDAVVTSAKETGADWQDMYKEAPGSHDTGGKYNSPLVNDMGMDFSGFGGLSG